MNAAPLLKHLIERTGGPAASPLLLVLEGEGLESLPEKLDTSAGPYLVARSDTELGLRRLVWAANGAPLIAVVPPELARRLPADLVHGARNQRVQALETGEVLSVLLRRKVQASDEDWFQRLVLDHVDRLVDALDRRTLPTVVTRRDLGELLVDVTLGEVLRNTPTPRLLAEWIEAPPNLDAGHLRLLREDALPRLHGDEGVLLAWALGSSASTLEHLLVTGLVLTVDVDVAQIPDGVWGGLRSSDALRKHFQGDADWLRTALVRLATGGADALGASAGPWLAKAEAIARKQFPLATVCTSPVLPLAFDDRAAAVAKQASRGVPIQSSELDWLRSHKAAPLRQPELDLLQWVARLSRYLALLLGTPTTTGEWVEQYLRHDAFADLAAAELQAALGRSSSLHEPAEKVLRQWERWRNERNEAFAGWLGADYERRLHDHVVPVYRVSKDLVAPKISAGERIYLVVLDGCSVPVFLSLLHELAGDGAIPIGLGADGRLDGGLALLPSITSHSRGALFAGRVPEDPFRNEGEWQQVERTTDPSRFAQNQSLGNVGRKLFLKGDLAQPAPLLAALNDPGLPLVAVVFNAVDDAISSHNTGSALRVAARDVRYLVPSLQQALRSGRKVLVTADHGHTRSLRPDGRVGNGEASRFVALGAGDPVPEGFVEVEVGSLGGGRGRLAFAWRMNTWLGGPHLGYHGGCSLEELVVPMAWLVQGGQAALEPGWWHDLPYAAAEPASSRAPEKVPEKAAEKAPEPAPAQLGLLSTTDRLAPLLAAYPTLGLSDLPLDPDERAVLVLLHQNERVSLREVHLKIGRPQGRIPGFMSNLRKKLAKHGSPLFEAKPTAEGSESYVWTGRRG
ncbi:MAG: BREX-2 system phosphatase PglZ [Myxococcota bacterium]